MPQIFKFGPYWVYFWSNLFMNKKRKNAEKASMKEKAPAVPFVFKNGESTVKKSRFENDDIRIFENENYELMQENLDGTARKLTGINTENTESKYMWLTNDWFYVFDGDGCICRTPFDRETQSICIDKNREVLVQLDTEEQELIDLLVTDSYLLYSYLDSEEDTTFFCIYELGSRKTFVAFVLHDDVENAYAILYRTPDVLPIITDNHFYLRGDEILYSVSFDTWEAKKISSDIEIFSNPAVAEQDGVLYFLSGNENSVYKYDGNKVDYVLKEKTFRNMIETMELLDDNTMMDTEISIESIHSVNRRLYILVFVQWLSTERIIEGKDKGQTIQNTHSTVIPLFADISNLSEWKVEQELLDYISENIEPDAFYYNEDDKVTYKTDYSNKADTQSVIKFMCNNKIFLYTYNGRNLMGEGEKINTFKYYVYDIETNKIEPIDVTDYAKNEFYVSYSTDI